MIFVQKCLIIRNYKHTMEFFFCFNLQLIFLAPSYFVMIRLFFFFIKILQFNYIHDVDFEWFLIISFILSWPDWICKLLNFKWVEWFLVDFSSLMGLLILLLGLLPLTAGQVSVSFQDTAVMVNEGEQFSLRVQKSGPVTKVINVIVEVSFEGIWCAFIKTCEVN